MADLGAHAQDPTLWPEQIAAAAVGATPSLLLVVDAAGIVRFVNPAAAQSLRLAPAAIVGRPLLELLDSGSHAKAERLLANVGSGDPARLFELNHLAGDGQIVLVVYRAAAMRLPDAAVLLIGQPAAETISTTERLLGLNRRLRALFALASAASRSLELGALLEQALTVIQTELGLQAGALFLRSQPQPLAPAQSRSPGGMFQLAAHRGFTPAFVARLAALEPLGAFSGADLAAGVQAVLRGTNDEVSIAATDLEYLTGPLLAVAATPLVSETRLIGWLYVVTDRYSALPDDELDLLQTVGNLLGPPVENARLYSALRETSGQLSAVLDGIDSGVLLIDEAGIVRYANARLGAVLGVDVAGWPGRARSAVLPGSLRQLDEATAYFEGELWEVAGTMPRILRRFAEGVSDHTGVALGSIEVWSDITQLYRTNQLRDEFVAAAAHDLKTPVTAVKGYAQIALRQARKAENERLVGQLQMINARSDDLAVLMDALLDMSRIQGGRLRLELTSVPLSELVASVYRHFHFDLQRRRRTLISNVPEEPLDVVWDRHRMEGVVINLIGNAYKYSPEGGEVTLRVRYLATGARVGPDAVEIAVTDHGIGIPVAEREQIFERFYRAEAAVAHGFRGTGIGLYISHSIVVAHGGQIWAADALHGGPGTTMFVQLPRVVARGDEQESAEADKSDYG